MRDPRTLTPGYLLAFLATGGLGWDVDELVAWATFIFFALIILAIVIARLIDRHKGRGGKR